MQQPTSSYTVVSQPTSYGRTTYPTTTYSPGTSYVANNNTSYVANNSVIGVDSGTEYTRQPVTAATSYSNTMTLGDNRGVSRL